jgi:hypothetical protein
VSGVPETRMNRRGGGYAPIPKGKGVGCLPSVLVRHPVMQSTFNQHPHITQWGGW